MKKNQVHVNKLLGLTLACTTLFSCNKEAITEQNQLNFDKPVGEVLASTQSTPNMASYELIWSDEFNSNGSFDNTKWSYAERGAVAWNKYMTASTDYVSQDGNNLLLRMDNAVVAGDAVPYHSGGVKSVGKFSMKYGKVEVRAKFTQGRGSWPAIWMMPEPATSYGGWPDCGEIDIMEHVNNESVIYHTIHNNKVTTANGGSSATKGAAYNTSDFNTYSMEWNPAAIKFYVNNTLQYTYTRVVGAGWQQWPFDVPFYLILNQAGGLGWPGAITNADLPFSMQVDYVRVYSIPAFDNGGFETNVLAPWTTWGSTSIASTDARTGTKSIKSTGGETAAEQILVGLTPNTTYKFSGYAKVAAAGQSVSIGVKDFGGTSVAAAVTSTSYQAASVTFTTGATQNSATVYFYKAGTGTAFGDDFTLEKL